MLIVKASSVRFALDKNSHSLSAATHLTCNLPSVSAAVFSRFSCGQRHESFYRVTEKQLDSQMLAVYETLRVEDADFRDTFREELRKCTNWDQESSIARVEELQAELSSVRAQQKRLTNHLLLEELKRLPMQKQHLNFVIVKPS